MISESQKRGLFLVLVFPAIGFSFPTSPVDIPGLQTDVVSDKFADVEDYSPEVANQQSLFASKLRGNAAMKVPQFDSLMDAEDHPSKRMDAKSSTDLHKQIMSFLQYIARQESKMNSEEKFRLRKDLDSLFGDQHDYSDYIYSLRAIPHLFKKAIGFPDFERQSLNDLSQKYHISSLFKKESQPVDRNAYIPPFIFKRSSSIPMLFRRENAPELRDDRLMRFLFKRVLSSEENSKEK